MTWRSPSHLQRAEPPWRAAVFGLSARVALTRITRQLPTTGQGSCSAGILTVDGILGRDMLRIGD